MQLFHYAIMTKLQCANEGKKATNYPRLGIKSKNDLCFFSIRFPIM